MSLAKLAIHSVSWRNTCKPALDDIRQWVSMSALMAMCQPYNHTTVLVKIGDSPVEVVYLPHPNRIMP